MNSALLQLSYFLEPDQIKQDEDSIKKYGKDWTSYFDINAFVVLFPKNNDQVIEIVKWARKNKQSLIPSGGRTGLSGAACATQGEAIVSLERMNQVIEFNPIEQTVTVQAGLITEQLQEFARSKNLYYPVDFAARGSSHIGGNIATNAGGIKVLRYGMTREWVIGLKVVTGSGELISFNQGLVKNATGFDFRHLFIGSEGTLGFVVEATMKLAQLPPPSQTLLMGVPSLDSIMSVFSEFKKRTRLSAFEMFSDLALSHVKKTTGMPHPLSQSSPFYLVIEYDLLSPSDEAASLQAFEVCLENEWAEDGTIAQSDLQARNFWKYREDITESLFSYSPYKNDISVTISKVPAFMADLDLLLKKNYPQWEVVWFGHIGDGNLHISILKPSDLSKNDFVVECRKVDLLLFETIQKYQGSISAEHGVGLTKKPFLHYSRHPSEIEYMRAIKKVFDPDLILNPGKIF